jgi:periplasmic protein TonB
MLQPLVSFTWETPRMSINLIESKRESQRSLRSTMLSIALHAAVITLAVYATASAGERIKPPIEVITPLYPPQTSKPTPTHAPVSHPSAPRAPAPPRGPVFNPHFDIHDELPPIDSSVGASLPESLFTNGGSREGSSESESGSGVDSGQPWSASQVEKPALPRDHNPNPKYPSVLENSRTEGTVLAQFVVDTLGRADMGTLKVLESSNDLFSSSVRAAIQQWRFYPAEAGGRRVKQIVQLPLKFVAPHH